MTIKQNKYYNWIWHKVGLITFLIYITSHFIVAENNIPPLIKRPDENDTQSKTIIAEVVVLKTSENDPGNNIIEENNRAVLDGNEAVSFIIQKLGIKDYELVYKAKQTLPMEEKKELNYNINDKISYYVVPKDVIPPGVFTLDTRVQIEEEGKKINAIQAVAKARVGEPLVYKGIKLENDNLIIVFTLKSEDNNQSKGGEQNQQKQEQEQEQQQKENEQNIEEQNYQKEQKGSEENKKENRQLQLLLESLDDMDQKEQKEMLNERERIMLPEKWW